MPWTKQSVCVVKYIPSTNVFFKERHLKPLFPTDPYTWEINYIFEYAQIYLFRMVIRWLHAHTEICIELCMCLYLYISPGKVHIFNQITKSIWGTHALSGGICGKGHTYLGTRGGVTIVPMYEMGDSLGTFWCLAHTPKPLCQYLPDDHWIDWCWMLLAHYLLCIDQWLCGSQGLFLYRTTLRDLLLGYCLIIIMVIGVVLKYFSR